MAQEYRTEQERMLDEIRNRTVDSVRPRSAKLINDYDTTHTGPFFAISALADATIDVDQCTVDDFIVDADVDFVIPQGMTIYGTFNSVRLAGSSGSVIAYYI